MCGSFLCTMLIYTEKRPDVLSKIKVRDTICLFLMVNLI